jgi:predicted metal-dependent hydrolase
MANHQGLALGIEQFNQQNFYACHDTLESVWLEAEPGEKNFYQGILQIAVAHYHLSNHNWQGTVVLLGEGIRRLKSFRPSHRGVDTESLIQSSWALLTEIQTVNPEQVEQWLAQAEPAKVAPKIKFQPN